MSTDLNSPLTENERAGLRLHLHRHALLLAGHLEALPRERAENAQASVRQIAILLETLADDHRLTLADHHAALRVQAQRNRLALAASLFALTLALLALAV